MGKSIFYILGAICVGAASFRRHRVLSIRRGGADTGNYFAVWHLFKSVAAMLLCAAALAANAQENAAAKQPPPVQAAGVVTAVKIEPEQVTLAPGESRQFTGPLREPEPSALH